VVAYLSLGLNCQPIMHAVENNLVPDRANGRLTSVFDLCLTTRQALCHFIQTDFADFFDDIALIENPKGSFSSPTGELIYSFVADASYGDLIVNVKHGMIFNHESPGHPFLPSTESWSTPTRFCQNAFREFRERYARRIANFLAEIADSIACEREVVFLMRANLENGDQVADAIKTRFPKLKFKIKILEFLEIDRMVNLEMQEFFHGSVGEGRGKKSVGESEMVVYGWA